MTKEKHSVDVMIYLWKTHCKQRYTEWPIIVMIVLAFVFLFCEQSSGILLTNIITKNNYIAFTSMQ